MSSQKWYFRTSAIVTGFLVVGPLILPLVWFNPYYSTTKKILLTFVILGVSWVVLKALFASLHSIQQYYDILQDGM